MSLTKKKQDVLDGIASTNNNKSVNDSNKPGTENYVDAITGTDVTAGHVLQNKRLSEMTDTEKDLMYSKQDEGWKKYQEATNKRFAQGVEAYSTGNKDLFAQYDKDNPLSAEMKSDVQALGRHGSVFTQDGNSATWSGEFYPHTSENLGKNVDLVKTIFERNKQGGVKFSKPLPDGKGGYIPGSGTFGNEKIMSFLKRFRDNQGNLKSRAEIIRALSKK